MTKEMSEISLLLRERVSIIADHAFRDRDPAGHLARLGAVSRALDEKFNEHRERLPGRLVHFMQQASYQKALALIDETAGKSVPSRGPQPPNGGEATPS